MITQAELQPSSQAVSPQGLMFAALRGGKAAGTVSMLQVATTDYRLTKWSTSGSIGNISLV